MPERLPAFAGFYKQAQSFRVLALQAKAVWWSYEQQGL